MNLTDNVADSAISASDIFFQARAEYICGLQINIKLGLTAPTPLIQ